MVLRPRQSSLRPRPWLRPRPRLRARVLTEPPRVQWRRRRQGWQGRKRFVHAWIHVPEEGRRTTLFPPEKVYAWQVPLPTWVPARIVRLLCWKSHGKVLRDVFTESLARLHRFCTDEDSSRLVPGLGRIGAHGSQASAPQTRGIGGPVLDRDALMQYPVSCILRISASPDRRNSLFQAGAGSRTWGGPRPLSGPWAILGIRERHGAG